jgi:hypothetical protein
MKKTINRDKRPQDGFNEMIRAISALVFEKYDELELSPAEVVGAIEATKYIVTKYVEDLMNEEDERGETK